MLVGQSGRIANQLAEHGYRRGWPTLRDVGSNLLDHLVVPIGFDVALTNTLFAAEKDAVAAGELLRATARHA